MSNPTIDLQEIQTKLVDKLRPSGWADKLKGFVMASDFEKILQFLHDERAQGRRFGPPLKHMFSAFENCPYKDLKVVIVGQDPYPQLGTADGMAFSCSLTGEAQPSLQYILKAIYKTTYLWAGDPFKHPSEENEIPSNDPDLTRWANQGVLLLNTALSVELGSPGKHQGIWRPFMSYLLDMLNTINSGVVFIFLGRKAQELADLIDEDRHYKLFASHPASAAYNNQAEWDCEDVFMKCNELLQQANGTRIKW
jgi:uracil-DNA glycosylase